MKARHEFRTVREVQEFLDSVGANTHVCDIDPMQASAARSVTVYRNAAGEEYMVTKRRGFRPHTICHL